jgi:plasmid maintenance system antidote protein VapI
MTILALHQALRGHAQRQIDAGRASVKLLARRTSLKPSHVSNFIHGRRALSVAALSRLTAALGFELEVMPTSRTR